MKRYTTGLITGILLTASAFMFMGAVQNNQDGRYQVFFKNTLLHMVDTQTADFYMFMDLRNQDYWMKMTAPNPFESRFGDNR